MHLLREVPHPLLLQAFHTTQKVTTHRLTLETLGDLDSVKQLIVEAHDMVGPARATSGLKS